MSGGGTFTATGTAIRCEMSLHRPSRAWLLGVVLALVAACSNGGERRFRYVDAVEVPAQVTERDQLAALMAGFAYRNGLSFNDTSPRSGRLSNGRQTLAFLIRRPLTNGRLWSEIEVTAIGNEPALITFAQPLDKGVLADSDQQRAALLAELRRRWPAMQQVPLLPDGGIPRQEDLRRTPAGLRIDPASATTYGLPPDSPLLAR